MDSLLQCEGLTVTVPGRVLVEELSLAIRPGECLAILGRNGAGKTLTLHTLGGLREAEGGEIRLAGRALAEFGRREIARRLALLLQTQDDPFPATVLETALAGRHPHIGFWSWERAADLALAREALQAMGLGELETRAAGTLSGGERRRLAIATVLTQTPELYLLDEPTNHLDPHHQLQVLKLFRDRAADGGAVAVNLHDANLASRFCTAVLLLFGDGEWRHGTTEAVLTAANLSRLYGTAIEEVSWSGGRLFVHT